MQSNGRPSDEIRFHGKARPRNPPVNRRRLGTRATMALPQSLLPYPQFTGVTESGMPLGTKTCAAGAVPMPADKAQTAAMFSMAIRRCLCL